MQQDPKHFVDYGKYMKIVTQSNEDMPLIQETMDEIEILRTILIFVDSNVFQNVDQIQTVSIQQNL